MSNLLTKSRAASFRSCQRLHAIKYLKGYRPLEDAGPLRFGSLVHLGLEQAWEDEPINLPAEADPWDLAKARPMLNGYVARWRDHDADTFEVLGVEVPFECDLINPDTLAKSKTWRLAGKIDAIVREKATGRVFVCEHKTSSQNFGLGSPYIARLRMDQQIAIYLLGAKSLGFEPAGVLYDILGKPRIRPLEVNSRRAVAETAAEYELRVAQSIVDDVNSFYQRAEVVRLENEVLEAMRGIWDQAQQMREAERLQRDIPNPEACERWGRLCEFFPVCSGETSLDNERLYQLSATVHPELSVSEEREVNQRRTA